MCYVDRERNEAARARTTLCVCVCVGVCAGVICTYARVLTEDYFAGTLKGREGFTTLGANRLGSGGDGWEDHGGQRLARWKGQGINEWVLIMLQAQGG